MGVERPNSKTITYMEYIKTLNDDKVKRAIKRHEDREKALVNVHSGEDGRKEGRKQGPRGRFLI